MTTFLIRDDDPNATTDPERLERAYAPLLDAGIPIAFSVIPAVALDTRDPAGDRERFLDPSWRDTPEEVPLTPDSPLSRWLRAHASEVDAMMHGLSHKRVRGGTELGALDEAEADVRLVQGRDILRTALGRTPLGLVAPWDAFSRGALVAAARLFPLISTSFLDRRRLPPRAWPEHVVERMLRRETVRLDDAWIVRHRGGRFDARSDPRDVPRVLDALAEDAEVTTIVLHHWMFWDAAAPHPVVVALAKALRRRIVSSVGGVVAALEWRARRPLPPVAALEAA